MEKPLMQIIGYQSIEPFVTASDEIDSILEQELAENAEMRFLLLSIFNAGLITGKRMERARKRGN